MLVYGDRVRTAAPANLLAQLAALDGGGCDRRTEALIVAGQLAQGLADAEMEASGADDATPLQAAAPSTSASASARPCASSPATISASVRRSTSPPSRAASCASRSEGAAVWVRSP